jgi:hypothetical protein
VQRGCAVTLPGVDIYPSTEQDANLSRIACLDGFYKPQIGAARGH